MRRSRVFKPAQSSGRSVSSVAWRLRDVTAGVHSDHGDHSLSLQSIGVVHAPVLVQLPVQARASDGSPTHGAPLLTAAFWMPRVRVCWPAPVHTLHTPHSDHMSQMHGDGQSHAVARCSTPWQFTGMPALSVRLSVSRHVLGLHEPVAAQLVHAHAVAGHAAVVQARTRDVPSRSLQLDGIFWRFSITEPDEPHGPGQPLDDAAHCV
jgi:hypothetical protein